MERKPHYLWILLALFVGIASAVAQGTTVFPIATNLGLFEVSRGIAFDGTNYLVGMQVGTNVVARLVSSTGALLGSQIIVGSNPGNPPPSIALALGKTNYLLVWSDSSVGSGVDMFGQFISRSGATVGTKFNLLQAQGSHGFQALASLACDGTNFLVVWKDKSTSYYYGQMVTPAGTLSGSEFLISGQMGNGNNANAAAVFGKTNYLVVWQSNNGTVLNMSQAFGEFVSRNGIAGSPFQIGQTSSVDQGWAAVAFDGTNYLAIWNWDPPPETGVSPTNLDLYARLVSPTGTFPGSELAVITGSGSQQLPSLAFDGSNYLLAWSDQHWNSDGSSNTTNYNIRFQFLNRSASAVGPEFVFFPSQGTNRPFLGLNSLLFDGTRYAMAATLGTLAHSNGNLTGFPSTEVFGGFIPTNTIQYTASPTNGAPPLTVQFNAPAIDSSGNAVVNWNWDFGDAATSSLQNPAHTYTAAGSFSPALLAANSHGAALLGIGPAISVTNPVVQLFSNLHNFEPDLDGFDPYAGLTLSGNTLYGTAMSGGSWGFGTVFAIHTDGNGFTNIWSFTSGDDGDSPFAGLFLSGTTLYGTTWAGGSSGYGTVFAVNTDGSGITNLHSFPDWQTNSSGVYTNRDGALPYAGLTLSGSTLYGTTTAGGTKGNGTVFAIKTNGAGYTNHHTFSASQTNSLGVYTNRDGAFPYAGLILSGNTLYGTTEAGGDYGYGTVFAINTDGTGFTNLHSFNGYLGDGGDPRADLLLCGNTLYGTAISGGANGNGSVFALKTDGTGFTNLYTFTALYGSDPYTNGDGASPAAGLILSGTNLFGTANSGGNSGNGTVFAVNTNGTGFTTLYTFSETDSNGINSDGASPFGGLVLSGNTLYGTTEAGGTNGAGTVFSLSLGSISVGAPQLAIIRSGTNVILTWPASATGFILQSTTNVAQPARWSTNLPAPAVVNGKNTVTNSASGVGRKFYRLSQ